MNFQVKHMRAMLRTGAGCVAVACLSMAHAHAGDTEQVLSIHGIGATSVARTMAEIARLATHAITVKSEKGLQVQYRCASVSDVLANVGVEMGTTIKGKRFSEYVKATARDGYEAVFALPELDPAFTDAPVQLCFEKNGATMPGDEGPLRLVVENELRHGRWVRQLVALTWVH